jgi:hypothetical protein
MLQPPHPMPDGANDKTYYRGEVVGATPEQQAWVAARDAQLAADDELLDAGVADEELEVDR